MIEIRKSNERGSANHGWLETKHTFSFADYYDPAHMGFRSLRVINEDSIEPNSGFDTHEHRDMEIITYVIEGSLNHKDSMSNGSSISAGEVQRMSAGTGVAHSEFNHSVGARVHLLQIWLLPEEQAIKPSYEQKSFSRNDKLNTLTLVASRQGQQGSMKINQDVSVFASVLDPGKYIRHELKPGRFAWIQVVSGELQVNGMTLSAGDGASASAERVLNIKAERTSEFLLFDLA